MSRTCEVCGKKPMSGHNVSHSHRKTKRRFLPNIQKAKLFVSGEEKSFKKICTQCIKTFSKIPREKVKREAKKTA